MIKFKKILCALISHKYYLIYNINKWSRKIKCNRCKKEFLMNDDCQSVIPWDSSFDVLYRSFDEIEITTEQQCKDIRTPSCKADCVIRV